MITALIEPLSTRVIYKTPPGTSYVASKKARSSAGLFKSHEIPRYHLDDSTYGTYLSKPPKMKAQASREP